MNIDYNKNIAILLTKYIQEKKVKNMSVVYDPENKNYLLKENNKVIYKSSSAENIAYRIDIIAFCENY